MMPNMKTIIKMQEDSKIKKYESMRDQSIMKMNVSNQNATKMTLTIVSFHNIMSLMVCDNFYESQYTYKIFGNL